MPRPVCVRDGSALVHSDFSLKAQGGETDALPRASGLPAPPARLAPPAPRRPPPRRGWHSTVGSGPRRAGPAPGSPAPPPGSRGAPRLPAVGRAGRKYSVAMARAGRGTRPPGAQRSAGRRERWPGSGRLRGGRCGADFRGSRRGRAGARGAPGSGAADVPADWWFLRPAGQVGRAAGAQAGGAGRCPGFVRASGLGQAGSRAAARLGGGERGSGPLGTCRPRGRGGGRGRPCRVSDAAGRPPPGGAAPAGAQRPGPVGAPLGAGVLLAVLPRSLQGPRGRPSRGVEEPRCPKQPAQRPRRAPQPCPQALGQSCGAEALGGPSLPPSLPVHGLAFLLVAGASSPALLLRPGLVSHLAGLRLDFALSCQQEAGGH